MGRKRGAPWPMSQQSSQQTSRHGTGARGVKPVLGRDTERRPHSHGIPSQRGNGRGKRHRHSHWQSGQAAALDTSRTVEERNEAGVATSASGRASGGPIDIPGYFYDPDTKRYYKVSKLDPGQKAKALTEKREEIALAATSAEITKLSRAASLSHLPIGRVTMSLLKRKSGYLWGNAAAELGLRNPGQHRAASMANCMRGMSLVKRLNVNSSLLVMADPTLGVMLSLGNRGDTTEVYFHKYLRDGDGDLESGTLYLEGASSFVCDSSSLVPCSVLAPGPHGIRLLKWPEMLSQATTIGFRPPIPKRDICASFCGHVTRTDPVLFVGRRKGFDMYSVVSGQLMRLRSGDHLRTSSDVLCIESSSLRGVTFFGSRDGSVQGADLRVPRASQLLIRGSLQGASVGDLKVAHDDNWLFASDYTGNICLFDVRMQGLRERTAIGSYHTMNSHYKLEMDLDSTERFLVSGGSDRVVRVWDVYTGEVIRQVSHAYIPTTVTLNSFNLARSNNDAPITQTQCHLWVGGVDGLSDYLIPST